MSNPETGGYSEGVPVYTGVLINQEAVSVVVDSDDVAHLFWIEATTDTVEVFTAFFQYRYRVTELCHMAIASDNTAGPITRVCRIGDPAVPYASANQRGYWIGQGSAYPGGGVALPYYDNCGQFVMAIFPSDIYAAPTFQSLPTLANPDPYHNSDPVVPYVDNLDFSGPSSETPFSLCSDGGGGLYLIAYDRVGVQVAHYDGGEWSGLAHWFDFPTTTDFYGTHTLFQYTLSAAYVPSRGQVGVMMSYQGQPVFSWLPSLSFPGFDPPIVQSCALITSSQAAQLIG
jgi:hypothetical protein